jgi:hypothetical protein
MALSLKAWVKINNQWQESNILVKNNNDWKASCPAVKKDGDWIKKIECQQGPPTFGYGSYTERYLQTVDPVLFQLFYEEGVTAYGIPPASKDGTNVAVQYSGTGFEYYNPDPPGSNRPYASPRFMNSLHLAVIPKGPHRGKVLGMSADVILTRGSPYLQGNPYSLQTATIIDFDKTAGTPEKPRFLTFQIPIEKPTITTQGAKTLSSFPNLFCAGHAWSPSGDLVIAGGSNWTWISEGGVIAASNAGILGAWDGTYVWNPALPGSWTSSTYTGGVRQDIQRAFTSGHYVSAGAWVRGPDMDSLRWYPTVLPYPRVSRTSNRHHMLLFGGDPLVRDQALTGSFASIPFEYNSYESLVISSMAASSNPGVYKDSYAGSTTFSGPSKSDYNQVYSALFLSANKDACCPVLNIPTGQIDYALSIFNDSFYYYPRCFTTSSGGVTYAGFTHRSSLLYSHDTGPGVWDTSVGNLSNTFDSGGAHDFFRWYGSAFRIPNNLNQNKIDDIVRCGGANIYTPDFSDQDTFTTDILELSKISGLTGTNNYLSWSSYTPMAEERSTFNTVILPNASIFAVGGVKNNPATAYCMTPGAVSFLEDGGVFSMFEAYPLTIADHHKMMGSPPTPTPITIDGIFTPEDDHLEHIVEMVNEIYDVEVFGSTEAGNVVEQFQFLIYPEFLNPNRTSWTLHDQARTISWRDYHSAATLLPDGRIVVAGGEYRHSGKNPKLNFQSEMYNVNDLPEVIQPYVLDPRTLPLISGTGWDYEIFTPGYLQEELMPSGIGISGATYNTHPQIDCYQLNYSGQYIVSSNPIYSNGFINKIVFMPPGNVTHHADTTQRYYECSLENLSQTQVKITMPRSEGILPRGFYMVFVISNFSVPSKAMWVWLN